MNEMKSVEIQYGEKVIVIELPFQSIIAFPHIKHIEKINNEMNEFTKCLRNPIGTLPLSEMVVDKKNAIVVIPDLTRPMPISSMLPLIVDELNKGGLKDENIKAVIALGTHRAMTEKEIVTMVGKEVHDRIRVVNHDWDNSEALVCMGKTPNGTWIDVNKEVYEADFVVGLSSVKPHRGAGWSGGAKIIDPGVCGKRTIDGTHYMDVNYATQEITGILKNPIREEMEQIAKAVGLNFSINLVLNENDEIVHISSGDFILAHKKAVEFAETIYRDPQKEKGDYLICGSGKWAPDFWSSVQGIFPAEYLVKEGGTVVIFASCPEGLSPEHPQLSEFGYRPLREIFKLVNEGAITDLAAAGHMATVSRILVEKNIECILVSEGFPREVAELMGLKWVENHQEAIDYIFKKHTMSARGYVFPVKSITDTVVIPW